MSETQLPGSDIWFVRAERLNVLADYFLENGIVEMGWGIGPLGPDDSKNEILRRLTSLFPERKAKTRDTWASEIRRFTQDMEVWDAVATCDQRRTYHIGIIRSLLVPAEMGPHYDEWVNDHVHRVEWLYQVAKADLSEYTQIRLSLPLTLQRLSPDASAELRQHCSG